MNHDASHRIALFLLATALAMASSLAWRYSDGATNRLTDHGQTRK